jgi:hypothetical protein
LWLSVREIARHPKASPEPAVSAGSAVARTTVRISGRMVPPMAVTFVLEAADDTFASRPGRSGVDGTFTIEAKAPLTVVGVHTIEADGTERRLQFTRQPQTSSDDWELGEVRFPVQTIEVECTLQIELEVAEALARARRLIRADIVEGRTNGPLRARLKFDLGRCLVDESARTVKQPVDLLCGGGDLFVLWTDVDEDETDPLCGFGWMVHALAAVQGPQRRSVLPVDAGHAIRGRVQWADGSPRPGQLVRFSAAGTGSRALVTNDQGEFCLLMDSGIHGQLSLEDRGPHGLPQTQEGGTGTFSTFCTGELPLQLRLLDVRGAPIERFRVRIGPEFRVAGDGSVQPDDFYAHGTRQPLPLHPQGVVSLPRERLQILPRLGIFVDDGRAHVLAIPQDWLAAEFEREVRLRDCLPEAALVIGGGGKVLHGLPEGACLRLQERAAQASFGIEFNIPCQTRLPWRIDHLLAGIYDLEITAGERWIARGIVTLTPGGSAEFALSQ